MTGFLLTWGTIMHKVKNRIFLKCILICLVLITLLSSSGCFEARTPPDIATAEKMIENKDIMTVVNYMANLKYNDIVIMSADGEMVADYVDIKITDETVNEAISTLKKHNDAITFFRNGNNIYITIWRHPQEISSGIAYSINGINIPEAQYQTEITPLSKDGWYYYVCDYHIWRSGE